MKPRQVLLMLAFLAASMAPEATRVFLREESVSYAREESPASGALRPAPLNATFDAKPATAVPGLTDSKGDATGEPPAWRVGGGLVKRDVADTLYGAQLAKADARSPGAAQEAFARLEGDQSSIVSSAFTIGTKAKALRFLYKFFEPASDNTLEVYVLSGAHFEKETLVLAERCDCSEWRTASVDTNDWAGQNIRVKFAVGKGTVGSVGIDDVAMNLLKAKLGRARKSVAVADPVDTSTGNFHLERTDIPAIPTKTLPLGFTRYYNSLGAIGGSDGWGLGNGWTHSYSFRIEGDRTHEPPYVLDVAYPDGRTISVTANSPNALQAGIVLDEQPFDELFCTEFFGGGPRLDLDSCYLTTREGIRLYFEEDEALGGASLLTRIVDRNGNTTTLTWSPYDFFSNAYLDRVTEPSGRYLQFQTVGVGECYYYGPIPCYLRIGSVTDSGTGRTVQYSYSESDGGMTQVIDVRGQAWQYQHATDDLDGAYLKSETDPLGIRRSTTAISLRAMLGSQSSFPSYSSRRTR
jgi:hypothetical protein